MSDSDPISLDIQRRMKLLFFLAKPTSHTTFENTCCCWQNLMALPLGKPRQLRELTDIKVNRAKQEEENVIIVKWAGISASCNADYNFSHTISWSRANVCCGAGKQKGLWPLCMRPVYHLDSNAPLRFFARQRTITVVERHYPFVWKKRSDRVDPEKGTTSRIGETSVELVRNSSQC